MTTATQKERAPASKPTPHASARCVCVGYADVANETKDKVPAAEERKPPRVLRKLVGFWVVLRVLAMRMERMADSDSETAQGEVQGK